MTSKATFLSETTSKAAIASLLKAADRIAIIIHQNPDGDALGCALALKEALLGKTVTVVCASPLPPIFQTIVSADFLTDRLPAELDAIVVLDCPELHRTGFRRQLMSRAKTLPLILIDHHPLGDLAKLTTHCLTRPAAATAELVSDLLDQMRVVVSPEIATALLLGLYTDTNGFQHSNTQPKTLRLASRLVRYGGDILKISQTLKHQQTVAQARLWGQILSLVRLNRYGVIIVQVPQKLLKQAGAKAEDVAGLVNLLALISEARAALVLIEEPGGWRGSLRTRHAHINVGQLAWHLGGHGHQKVGGFVATNK